MTKIRESRSERIDVRTTPAVKQRLQEAAQATNKTVTEFLLDSALDAAGEALADRRVFQLDAARWNAFLTALDRPPQTQPRLERLLRESSVFE